MEASPTPYDIVGIPLFPYIPNIWLWIFVVAIAVVLLFIFKKIHQKKEVKLFNSAYDEILTDLSLLSNLTGKEPRESLNKASLLVRRFLETHATKINANLSNITGLSLQEISEIAEQIRQNDLKTLLTTLLTVEDQRFSSNILLQDAKKLIEDLEKNLRKLRIGAIGL